jgi:hypothetical protein
MAEKQTVTLKKEVKRSPPKVEYASADEVKELSSAVSGLVDIVTKLAQDIATPPKPQTVEEIKHEAEVTKASPAKETVNSAWVEKATEIVGESLDHCEVFYPKNGGTIFTLVIKESHSNAAKDYLERYKTDRRSKEIGNEGIEGVEAWCKLVRDNLKRGK